jgi:hypothetical protein
MRAIMRKEKVTSFQNYLDFVEAIQNEKYVINLFRGQSNNAPLLPSIARQFPNFDTTEIEIKMLDDLKRRSLLLINKPPRTDWEWLVFAQHFGLKTRLLDWTSNPLIALWFACSSEYAMKASSFVYALSVDNDMLVNIEENESPFQNERTKILRPTLNNERIIAQLGWFTAHRFSNTNKAFVALETHRKLKTQILELEITANLKEYFLRKLSIFGVNSRTVYPDVTGLCLHLNWKYQYELINSVKTN